MTRSLTYYVKPPIAGKSALRCRSSESKRSSADRSRRRRTNDSGGRTTVTVRLLLWRAAGYHVERVYLARRRVRFGRGERGGRFADSAQTSPTPGSASPGSGIYRLTLTGGITPARPRVYIGESDNLRRRRAENYRNPAPRQQTSLRINAILVDHLTSGARSMS